MNPGTNINC